MKNILIISIVLLVASCKSNTAEQKMSTTETLTDNITLTEAQLKNAGIQTTTLSQKEMAVVLKVNGKIDVPPQNLVSVSVPLAGLNLKAEILPPTVCMVLSAFSFTAYTNFLLGDTVKKDGLEVFATLTKLLSPVAVLNLYT